MNFADRVCDLECVKKAPLRHEFVGPVKIILVEPLPADYKRKAWGSALLSLATLFMGATVFTVFFFTLNFKLPFPENVHIFLCTMGFQLFMPAGIMMVNSLFGGAAQLKPTDRKYQHFLLQLFAVACGGSGSFIVFYLGQAGTKFTIHSITGLSACGLIVCTGLIGPTVYFLDQSKSCGKFHRTAHVVFALPSLFLSMACFVLGLLKPSFITWSPVKDLHFLLIGFTVIYTLCIFYAMYMRDKLSQ